MDENIIKSIINPKLDPITFDEVLSNSTKKQIQKLIKAMDSNGELRAAVEEKINVLKSLDNLPFEIEAAVTKFLKMMRKANDKKQANLQEPNGNDLQGKINHVCLYYPAFQKDLPILKGNDFIQTNGVFLHWKKSKKSLSEYFGYQKSPAKWAVVEILFNIKGLKNSFSTNGTGQKKYSRDYETWLAIKNTPQSK